MEAQKSQTKELYFSKLIEKASSSFEEASGRKLNKNILTTYFDELKFGVWGTRRNNSIIISQNILGYDEAIEFVFFHEFLHWAISTSNIKSERFSCGPQGEIKFVPPILLFSTFGISESGKRLGINFVEEGIAEFFAATQMSKDKEEIPFDIFFDDFASVNNQFFLVENGISEKDVFYIEKFSIEQVYETLKKINGFTTYELYYAVNKVGMDIEKLSSFFKDITYVKEMINNLGEMYSSIGANPLAVFHQIGKVTALFAFEIYENEGKDEKILLKDFINYPYAVVEKTVREIKNSLNEELLNETIFDFVVGFSKKYDILRIEGANKEELKKKLRG